MEKSQIIISRWWRHTKQYKMIILMNNNHILNNTLNFYKLYTNRIKRLINYISKDKNMRIHLRNPKGTIYLDKQDYIIDCTARSDDESYIIYKLSDTLSKNISVNWKEYIDYSKQDVLLKGIFNNIRKLVRAYKKLV